MSSIVFAYRAADAGQGFRKVRRVSRQSIVQAARLIGRVFYRSEDEHPNTSDSELKDSITNSAKHCMTEPDSSFASQKRAAARVDAKSMNQLHSRHSQ
jgi:hypothetical protein